MSASNTAYVLDKSDELMSHVQLKEFSATVQKNKLAGDIRWHPAQMSAKNAAPLIESIEAHLEANNECFSRFPNDFVHAQMSEDVYRSDLTESESVFVNQYAAQLLPSMESSSSSSEETSEWRVLKVYEEPREAAQTCKKGGQYTGVIYYNEGKRQMVLAHRGANAAELQTFFKEETVEETLATSLVPQLAICFEVTREANELANEKECYLSFTGYSNGAWLAEYSNYFAWRFWGNKNTRAVLFESPGVFRRSMLVDSDENLVDLDLTDLNQVNYLCEISLLNTLNKHVGSAYRLFINTDKEEDELAKESLVMHFERMQTESGRKLHAKCASSRCFVNSLVAILDRQRMKKITELFDSETGMPHYCEDILNWPLVKYFETDFDEDILRELISDEPVPSLIKVGSYLE